MLAGLARFPNLSEGLATLSDMAHSSTNLGLEVSLPTIDDLLDSYDMWSKTADRMTDEFDLMHGSMALYRFAIANYNEPGIELVLKAIVAFESAKAE